MSTIKTLIIEDETLAARRIERMLKLADERISVVGILESVSSAIQWLQSHPHPDLMILDIHLADGLSFDIFKTVKVESFVVFTTAYDQYAIKAFELNSIDYLLKPVEQSRLNAAVDKFLKLTSVEHKLPDLTALINTLSQEKKEFKRRFAVNAGDKIKTVEVDEISYFYSMEKNTFLCTTGNIHYAISFSLDKLETMLDNSQFFRVNRQYLIHVNSIDKISVLSGSRLKVEVNPRNPGPILVSNSRTHEFRAWLDQ